MVIYAHRGGWAAGKDKENTVKAFKEAVRLGFDHIETDVILTSDGEVVAYHGSANRYMQRKIGLLKRADLQKLTYDDVRQKIRPGGEEVPRLQDVLLQFPNVKFSIDAKTDEVVAPLASIVNKTNTSKRVMITSFSLGRSLKVAERIQRKNAGFDNASICIRGWLAVLLSVAPGRAFRYLSRKGIRAVQMPHKYINERIVRAARCNNIKTYAWTVNDKSHIKQLVDLGVDGIISDDILLAKQTLSTL